MILSSLLLFGCGAKEKTEHAAQTQDSEVLNNEPSSVFNPQQQASSEQNSDTAAITESQKAADTKTGTPKIYSLKVGGYFPPFTLNDLNGSKISSADLFSSNTVTLINFWSTFCSPCIREMPGLETLWQQYSGQGLGVIGIILDSQKAAAARNIAAELGTTYPHLLDDGRYGASIRAVPQTLLVDSEGKILQSVTGARALPVFIQMVEPYL